MAYQYGRAADTEKRRLTVLQQVAARAKNYETEIRDMTRIIRVLDLEKRHLQAEVRELRRVRDMEQRRRDQLRALRYTDPAIAKARLEAATREAEGWSKHRPHLDTAA